MKHHLRFASLFLLLAVIFGALRFTQTHVEIPGAALRFTESHSIHWDPAVRALSRTGSDPFLWIYLPASRLPVREFTIEFEGPPNGSDPAFYVYQFPAHLNGVMLGDPYVTRGQPSTADGRYTVHWQLANSKIVRLDLPDDLDRPLIVRRIMMVSGFNGSWAATLMWLFLVLALGALLAGVLPRAVRRRSRIEAVVVLALVGLKLVVASDVRLAFFGAAMHDDGLFVKLADTIMRGHWLGHFTQLTLAKGPVYSLFLAATGATGIPLLCAQTLLHAAACIVLVQALRPLLPSVNVRLLLLAVVLFDPHTVSSEEVGRVLRSGIQPALTLFVIAGAAGLALRLKSSPRAALAWSVLTGIAFPLFWYSREEGVWLVPSLVVILAAVLLEERRGPRTGRWARVALLALPVGMFGGAFCALRTVNAVYYGAPITVDVKDSAFPRAYGALVRVTPARLQPLVPVARETRLRLYAISPAFAELQPFLEGDIGHNWVRVSESAPPAGVAPGEIRGGWFQWALREAAGAAGHYRNAATADAYWARVAREINAACDAGRIAAGPARNSFFPRWDRSLTAPLGQSFEEAANVAIRFSDFSIQYPPRANTPDEIALFTRITHESSPTDYLPYTARTHARRTILQVYSWVGPFATLLAVLATVVVAVQSWRRRTTALRPAILLALLGGALALMIISALIDVTSFSAVHTMYLGPATSLVLASWVLAPAFAGAKLQAPTSSETSKSKSQRTS